MKINPALLLLAATLRFAAVSPAADPLIANGGFEDGLAGWFVPKPIIEDGWTPKVIRDGAVEGAQCVEVGHAPGGEPKMFGNLMRSIDATPLRGKRVRFSVQVKHTGSAGSKSQPWLRVDRPGGRMGFFDNCKDRPVTKDAWTKVEIVGDVAEDAAGISLGMMVIGKGGVARFDDAQFEVVGNAALTEAARALSERGLENVTAFTRLLGCVRYFHPSDQAAALTAAQWDQFAVNGMRAVESAADAKALAAQLAEIFRPVAPTVVIAPDEKSATVALPAGAFVHAWQHTGLGSPDGQAAGGVYRSVRSRKAAPAQMEKPWVRELASGVVCAVPLALYGDDAGTLPKVAATTSALTGTTALSARDRAVRLAAVATAWNVPEHFFPYFDVVKTDWPAVLRDSLRAAATDADEEAFFRTMQRLGAALKDGHVYVNGPGQQMEFAPNVRLAWADGKLCVAQSKAADLAPGDALLAIDGVPVEKAAEECLRQLSVPSPQGGRMKSALHVLAGKQGSTVRLTIEPFAAPGTQREISATRDTAAHEAPRPKRERQQELKPGIFYLDLEQWTAAEFTEAWPKLAEARGLVIEFRNYPNKINVADFFGHFAGEMLTSAQWHIPAVTRPDREGLTFFRGGEWMLPPVQPRIACPRAFLIDASCISYAESCLGIVEHYKLGALVGGPTMGTNGNINSVKIPGGYTMSFTGMKVLKQDGSQHHGIGIRPTVAVEPTRQGLADGRDEIVEKALEIVAAEASAAKGR